MDGEILTPVEVRDLALQGRVAPSPNYHANAHHIRFEDIVVALSYCERVVPDRRPNHPRGFLAWCPYKRRGHLRVDFDLVAMEDGRWVLIVTAMEA